MRGKPAVAACVALAFAVFGLSGCTSNTCEGQSVCGEDNDANGPSAGASGGGDPSLEASATSDGAPASASATQDPTDPGSRQSAGGDTDPGQDSPSTGVEEPSLGPQTTHLSEMRPIEKRAYSGTAQIAGTPYTSSIWKDIGPSDNLSSVYVVYALDGKWTTFVADVGPDSDSRADAVIDFEVYLDGRQLGETHRTTVTRSAHIEEKVTEGVQLRLVAKHVSGSTNGAYTGQAAWGSARLEN